MKEALRRVLPKAIFSGLRRLYYHHPRLRRALFAGRDLADRTFGARDPLVPPRSLQIVGDGDYRETGRRFLEHFVELGGLRASDRVLEVGCGTGRMAIAIGSFLTTGSYRGFDIVPESIAWAREALTPRFPMLSFDHADVRNALYNPNGRWTADAYRFPYDSASFDFVFATSVFTHMRGPEISNYLSEITRCLRPGGACFATFFLLPPAPLSPEHSLAERFGERFDDGLVVDVRIPEAAIAHPEGTIRGMYAAVGLEIREPIFRGSWSGFPEARSTQDIVIAIRRAL